MCSIINVRRKRGYVEVKINVKWIQYLAFIAIGLISNIIGPLLPTIKHEIPMSYGQLGTLLSETFLGMLVMGVVGSYVMDKYGKKAFLLAGGFLLVFGLFGTVLSKTFIQIYILNFITGMGFGIYEVGINALCADYSGEAKGNDMNFLHFFYGLGAILGPVFVWMCVRLGMWKLCFAIAAIFPIIVTILILNFKGNKIECANKIETEETSQPINVFTSRFLWIAGITIFIYVGVEVSTYGWIPTFCKSVISKSVLPSSLAATLFWITMTAGRLVSGKIADKIGLEKFILTASAGTMIVAFSWVALPAGTWTIISILLMGLLLSGMYPTLMAVATCTFPKNTGLVASFISIFGAVGGALIPWIIGRTSDRFGIGILAASILGLSIIMTVLSAILLGELGIKSKQSID
jgi:fucose permease